MGVSSQTCSHLFETGSNRSMLVAWFSMTPCFCISTEAVRQSSMEMK